MHRGLVIAVSVTGATNLWAAIPAEVATVPATLPAAAKLAFFASAYQQLLKGGANP